MKHESDIGFSTPEEVEFARKVEKVRPYTSLAGALLGAGLTVGVIYWAIDKTLEQRELDRKSPLVETGQTDIATTNRKITIAYEGQREPRCAGDIERTVPQINKRGEVTGLTVYCKPEAAVPAK